tara:strand:- start:10941 stop:12092 length:1152 start_codon:yes stop_codon:yes gene_type:complete
MIMPIIPMIAGHFEITGGIAAQIVTAFALGRFVGQPIGGVLIDRFGTRIAITVGPLIIGLSVLVASISSFFWPLLIALFIAGIADSSWMLGREVAGVDLVKANQRGRLMSGFMGFHAVGMGLGGLAGGVLADASGFRAVFALYTFLSLLVFIVGYFAPNSKPLNREVNTVELGLNGNFINRIKGLFFQIDPTLRSTYLVLVFATASMMLYRMSFQSMFPLYADEIGMSASRIGFLFFLMTFGSLIMIIPAGFIVDKVGRKWATVPSTMLPGLAFLVIPFLGSFNPLIVIAVAMGFANGLSLGSVATSTYDVVPDSARARLQAARRTFSEVGAITGPLLGGVLAVNYGAGITFFVYAPVLLIAAALLMFVAKETLVKPAKLIES